MTGLSTNSHFARKLKALHKIHNEDQNLSQHGKRGLLRHPGILLALQRVHPKSSLKTVAELGTAEGRSKYALAAEAVDFHDYQWKKTRASQQTQNHTRHPLLALNPIPEHGPCFGNDAWSLADHPANPQAAGHPVAVQPTAFLPPP